MFQSLLAKFTGGRSGELCWQLIVQGAQVIDVRSPEEFAAGHLPQAINVPLPVLEQWLAQVENRTQTFVLYCGAGIRAQKGCDIFKAKGFECVINGGSLNDMLSSQPK
ncbi:rhodanese-like domain-containing protein [Shewanella acanthi]|uniref:rhodanese-like domain-containing protein n=1 Tax=Shewanella acanthi TaxID=2864212 RepID=UPI001C65EF07|nr:rhodanese-like domain-containing protein [Shewanella acanthi]QYJ79105.1 rhodanese-like domain-containing protein [Shewanella acanthi]